MLAAALIWVCSASVGAAAELERIVQLLALSPGMRVADVGAGDGAWSELLAHSVGDRGHVWATEIEASDVTEIADRVAAAGLANVTAVLGTQRETGLPEGCCDAILLRMVYHHFIRPAEMRRSLRRALRSGGRIAVVDIEPQESWRDLPDVPDRGGHGIAIEDLVAEMTGDGFEVVTRIDDWNGDEDRYCVVFRR